MTLVEFVVASGISVLALAVGMSLPIIAQKSLSNTQNAGSRNLSLFQTTKLIAETKTLRLSSTLLPQNEALAPCILGGPSGACGVDCCNAGVATGFYAIDRTDPIAAIESKARLSGPPASPVEYTQSGDPCNPASPPSGGCAYKISSEFTAHCAGDALTCDHADYITISLELQPNAGSLIKPEKTSLIHFVTLNYKPYIAGGLANQSIAVGSSLKVGVSPEPGHSSEARDFVFEQCESTNPATVKVTCYGFINGTGYMVLEALAAGTSTIRIQVNDTAEENFLSDVYTFTATGF